MEIPDPQEEPAPVLPETPLTAASAARVALFNSPRLLAAYEALGVRRADLARAGLPPNPGFEGEVRYVEAGGGEIHDLNLMEDVMSLALLPLARKEAGARYRAEGQETALEALHLMTRAAEAVHRVQADREILGLLEKNLDAARASRAMAGKLREAGNITELRLLGEETLLQEARLLVEDRKAALALSRERLGLVLGLEADAPDLEVAPLPPLPDKEPDFNGVETRALEKSLSLAAGENRLAEARARGSRARAVSVFPRLSLGVAAERDPGGEWSVGPALSTPLPLFDQGFSARAGARAEIRKREHLRDAASQEIVRAARSAVVRVRAAWSRASSHERVLVPLAERILASTHLQYNAMQVGVFRLLEAKRSEIAVRTRAIRERARYHTEAARLAEVLNGGLPRDLAEFPGHDPGAMGDPMTENGAGQEAP